MKVNENLLSGVFVQRQAPKPVVEQPASYEEYGLDGLPFYYHFGPSFGFLMIALGLALLVGQILFIVGGCVMPFYMKKYICTKCKRTFVRLKALETCPICRGKVVPVEDYDPDKKLD